MRKTPLFSKGQSIMENKFLDIKQLADLANIALTQEECLAFSRDFDGLLRFLHSITETEIFVPQLSNAAVFFRDDEVCDGFCRDELLANAATTAQGYITVPLVMEDI